MSKPIITGTWIDIVHPCPRDGVYWNRKTLAYTAEEWSTLVRHLRRDLGMEMLMLQIVAKDGLTCYPSTVTKGQWHTPNCADPVGAIFRACSAEGVAMYPGIGIPHGAEHSGPAKFSKESFAWYRRTSEEILERYGNEASFGGWYVSHEMAVRKGAFDAGEIAFTRKMNDLWKSLTPKLPTIASPYFEAGEYRIQKTDSVVRAVQETGLSAIAYQDGVGVATAVQISGTGVPNPDNNARLFEDLRWVHDRTDVKLWANTELFCFENNIFFQPLVPAPFERVRKQIVGAAPFVDRIVAYTTPGIMTCQSVCPGLGAPETDRLYWAYRGYREGAGAAEAPKVGSARRKRG